MENELSAELKKDHRYNYPLGLDLRPSSDLHQRLVQKICRYERSSRERIQNRFDSWERVDRAKRAYVSPEERRSEGSFDDEEAPEEVVIPVIYLLKETLMAQYANRFIRLPYFNYIPASPEDPVSALLYTKLIEKQCIHFKTGLDLWINISDQLDYGIGPAHVRWVQEFGRIRRLQEATYTDRYGNLMTRGYLEPIVEEGVLFEGNRVEPISPYLLRNDPNYAPEYHQRGEHSGWVSRENLTSLMEDEERGQFFNVSYLKECSGVLTLSDGYTVPEEDWNKGAGDNVRGVTRPVDIIWQYVKLSPKDWEIGDSERVEIYLCAVAGGKVIIAFHPMELDWNGFPTAIAVSEVDGRSMAPISKMEITWGAHYLVNQLIQTHTAAVLQGLHHILLVNPKLINLYMSRRTRYGTMFFMSNRAVGLNISPDQAMKQLQLYDFTQGHLKEALVYTDWIQRISGATEELAGGVQRKSESPTATEVGILHRSAMNRVGARAMLLDIGYIRDLGMMMAMNTRQFMTQEMYVQMTGEWEERLMMERGLDLQATGGMLRISPFDIQPLVDLELREREYDIESPDLMKAFLNLVLSSEEAVVQMDVPRMIRSFGRRLGFVDVDDWVRKVPSQVRVMGQDKLEDQVARGNLVPMEGVA
ncbi:MAG TPA: hypothetical protein VLH56_08500 [Dissulfurispiraceae bacterium]|nr:hypothetical protein [Dissulfurispiraceae bacterium]